MKFTTRFPANSWLLTLLVVLLSAASSVWADSTPETHPVKVKLIARHQSLSNSDPNSQATTTIGAHFTIEPGWHIYWKNSGESAMPTRIKWTAANAWQLGQLRWPTPIRFIERGDITTFGYKNSTVLLTEVTALSPEAYSQKQFSVDAKLSWLVCKDICIPGRADLSLTIPLTPDASSLAAEATLIDQTLEALPRFSIPDLEIKTRLDAKTFAPSSKADVLFSISGLKKLDEQTQVQIFPNPSDHLSLSAPESAWHNDTLYVRAELKAGASLPLEDTQYGGVIALSAKELKREISLEWTLPLSVKATAESLNTSVLDNDTFKALADLDFTPSQYRLSHWQEQHDNQDLGDDSTPSKVNSTNNSNPSFLLILVFAFIGGMILNLMPCVLPIIAIKVMGFIEQSKTGSKGGAISFCAGVLFSFIVLAAVVITLRSLGHQLGWGFQFQHPEFVFFIALVVFVLALGFFDMYTLALPFMQRACTAIDSLEPSKLKHFFDGIIATILSTPCTAPFLGTALVFAFTQGPLETMAIHLAIGLGLATPYFLLATNPRFISILPKPGNWMHKLRQFMGFMLLGTVVWLLFVMQKLTGQGVVWTLLIMLTLVFCVWLYDWSKDWGRTRRGVARFVAAIILVLVVVSIFPKAIARVTQQNTATIEKHGISWEPYSKAIVKERLAQGHPVFIDFTADWCITCKANEYLIISTSEVVTTIKELGVSTLIADWTNGDPKITEALSSYGARGVPLYVVISPKSPDSPVILSTIPGKSTLIEALRTASRGLKK